MINIILDIGILIAVCTSIVLQMYTSIAIRQSNRKEDSILAAIDDLKAAVSDEAVAISELTTDVGDAVTKILSGNASETEIEAAAQAIASSNALIRASAQKLKDAVTPPTTA